MGCSRRLCCNFRLAFDGRTRVERRDGRCPSSGGQFEELVDELNLTPNISSVHPPNLSLPHHIHRLITLNRSLRRLEFSEPLLSVPPAWPSRRSVPGPY